MFLPRRRLYWVLQVAGWALYGALGLLMIHLFAFAVAITWHLVAIQVTMAAVLVLTSHGLRTLFGRRGWRALGLGGLLWRLALANGAAALGSQLVLGALIAFVIRPPASLGGPAGGGQFVGYVLQTYFVLWLWTACYFGLHYLDRYKQAEVDRWKLAAAAREAELRTLQAQLNPHFLFNGLNNIRALVMEDPARARAMMTHLAELLRYAMQRNGTAQVPLATELEIVDNYLQLEALQLEERLRYSLDVAPDALPLLLPPMTLQLLVENAIKHGLAPRPAGGQLSLSARRAPADGSLCIAVRNTGTYQPRPGHAGVGVRNVRERLHLLFGPAAAFAIGPDPLLPDTVLAELRLPASAPQPAADKYFADEPLADKRIADERFAD
ncbi:sensor histidine kinase [Hymenobacter nivis]|uniref:Histidine kinase n=1 Tax=Hymenobacter nivis TaxID=1850093 RepID=A0A2Z3GQ87_9BACT|nr:histidine kinase [Hymenobacter nivis]AWM34272.1 histidine kinase [Hymenobacter nivis]